MIEKQEVMKLMLVGSNMVGKTAFLFRFCENNYKSNYEETQGIDLKSKIYNEGKLRLQIFDTPGAEKLKFASFEFYKSAFWFYFVF
ncbi:unnamed protein product [Paramecium sonneborni]|uniref:Uncharacterized protein n=1 Tax=Paramecium sonneborni TaxID=65129 RepID=A0A8S1RAF7_9CILI|nr:unnamed protein product [Paramecium sonneborni]